jgi:hypothetical protein
MRETSDRSPEEARTIIVLMFVWAFWKNGDMTLSLKQFHRAFRSILLTLKHNERGEKDEDKEKEVEQLGFVFDSNRKDALSVCLNLTLKHLQKKGILAINEENSDEKVIEFNRDTQNRLRHELESVYKLEAEENKILMLICKQAVKLYLANVRHDNDCNE